MITYCNPEYVSEEEANFLQNRSSLLSEWTLPLFFGEKIPGIFYTHPRKIQDGAVVTSWRGHGYRDSKIHPFVLRYKISMRKDYKVYHGQLSLKWMT
jgi:hypothetical protein